MVCADWICLSQTTSIRLIAGGFLCQIICTNNLKKILNLLMVHFFEGISYFFMCSNKTRTIVTTQNPAVPTSGYILSQSLLHSICTALLAKHVKSVMYLLCSFLPSFIRNGLNISMPQLVNGGPSNVLSFGWSAIDIWQISLPDFWQ